MPPKRKAGGGGEGVGDDSGSGDPEDDDYSTRQYADKLGFNDPSIPRILY